MKKRMILSIAIMAMATLNSTTVYSQKGKQKEKQPAQNVTVMQFGQETIYGPYTPSLTSIRQHECPEWFRDAKFGMFIDWGLYSVAGWDAPKASGSMYPDWYLKNMLGRIPEVKEYHEKTWGKDFMPDDFIPLFTAENYNPEWLIGLAKKAGMKYVIPFCKHHDGFCLWPSSYTERDAMDMGPKKDLVRPLVDACYKNGLKFGFYFSLDEWYYPVVKDGVKQIREWGAHKYVPYEESKKKIHLTGKYPVEDFFGDYIVPQAKEFIDLYDPDILWFDGDWEMFAEEYRSPEIIAHFYNRASGRKEVALNDRNGRSRSKIGDFFCSEYHDMPKGYEMMHPWEENRGISQSFGYNREDTEENVLSVKDFVHMFIRTVSENGNLLLIVNLDGKGGLPEVQERRLREIGAWLKINGEAIYGTRPWLIPVQDLTSGTIVQNDDTLSGAAVADDKKDNKQQGEIRFTRSKDGQTLYAICTAFPKDKLEINSLYLNKGNSTVTMIGAEETQLSWSQHPEWNFTKLVIDIPDSLYGKRKNEYAWVFKITF
ncbi:MAG: alpha-L-fucosidase [Bacteroidales bacterium]|jgi:alpha-L-fucosidase|nr:alpha-L-fucosidase [Bacteroidales bacterium]